MGIYRTKFFKHSLIVHYNFGFVSHDLDLDLDLNTITVYCGNFEANSLRYHREIKVRVRFKVGIDSESALIPDHIIPLDGIRM